MSGYTGKKTSLAHREHPLLGRLVRDGEGRVGILSAVAPNADPAPKYEFIPRTTEPAEKRSKLDRAEVVAWLKPEGGGIEWPADLEGIAPA